MKSATRKSLASRLSGFLALVALVVVPLLLATAQGENPMAKTPELRLMKERAMKLVDHVTQAQADRRGGRLRASYHASAVLQGPNSLGPVTGRAALASLYETGRRGDRGVARDRLYMYLRQPTYIDRDGYSFVLANYEMGERVQGEVVETSGKVAYALVWDKDHWEIVAEAKAPNLNAGSYGPLGTALASQRALGTYPVKAVLAPKDMEPPQLKTEKERRLQKAFGELNHAFMDADIDGMMDAFTADRPFAAGDFSPFYLEGQEAIRQHFEDFFATSRMVDMQARHPEFHVFGNLGLIAFEYNSVVEVNGEQMRSPGQAVYFFEGLATTDQEKDVSTAGCVESGFVARELGDPYGA